MSLAATLLKARHVGVRDLRNHLSHAFKKNDILVVTEHGQPSKVVISYEEMLELIDIVDEMEDSQTVRAVLEGKEAVNRHEKAIPVARLLKKIRRRLEK